MSKNEVAMFQSSGALVVPDYITESYGELTNLTGRKTTPSLLFEGKVWQYSVGGQKHQINGKNAEGDLVPVQIIRVCIVDFNQFNGRTFYEGVYDPSKPGAPRCWSEDGVAPSLNVAAPVAVTCKACPNSKKGSKVSASGAMAQACSVHRLLAVVPLALTKIGPLRMKLAGTSVYEDSDELKKTGWLGFQAYAVHLAERGVKHLSQVVTKMKFDPGVPFPKPLFQAERFLSQEELAIIRPYVNSPEVKEILNIKPQEPTNAPARGGIGLQADAGQARIAMPIIESKAIEAAAAYVDTADDEVAQAPPPKAKSKVKQTKKPVDDDEVVEAEPQQVVKSPSASPKPGPVPDLEAILDDWSE